MKKQKCKLYHGDCLEIMKKMPDKSVDLTVTSPPYNLGNNHHTGNKRFFSYFDNMPENEYQLWQITVLNEIYRITKDTGSIIYNHKNRIKKGVQITPYEWILKSKWVVKQEIVWFNRSQNFDKIRFYPMTERFFWLAKDKKTKLHNVINHHDLFSTDEWKAEGTNKEHKRSFPEKMVDDFLQCFSESISVFDPFMGSGTTGKMAMLNQRDFIGIEKDEEYFKIAKRRTAEAAK
jgi:site-specific DNA-methyltransferase (adenine-specific)